MLKKAFVLVLGIFLLVGCSGGSGGDGGGSGGGKGGHTQYMVLAK